MGRVKSRGWLGLVLLGAPFVLRCGLWWVWRHAFTWGDGLFYAAIAEHFFQFGEGHDYLLLFPPGYPLAVALFRFFLSLDAALVAVSLVAGSLLPSLVWWITRRVTEERVAWYAWALTSCSPLLLGLSMERLADSVFIALIAGALGLLIVFYRTARMRWFAAFCVLSAFSVQTKPEGLALLAVQSFLCLSLFRGFTLARRFVLVACLWAVVAAIGSPYWIFLHERTGVWMVSGKAPLNLLHARAKAVVSDHSEELKTVYREAFALDSSGRLAFLTRRDGFCAYMLEDPLRAFRVYWGNVKRGLAVVSPAAFPLVLALCAGCVGWWIIGRRVELILLLSPLVLLLFPPFFVSMAQPSFHPGRLAGPVIPSLAILAATGVWKIGAVVRRPRLGLWILIAWAAGCLVFAWHETVRLDRTNQAERRLIDLHRKEVSQWLAANTPQDAIIASTSLLDDAYSGRRTAWLPWEETPRLLDYLRFRGVGYLLQERGGGLLSPGIERLKGAPRSLGLDPVAFLDTTPAVTIYRVLPRG